MISVVIPLYNKVNFIAKTIESVLSQTFQEFEIIIVDDGSTDGSVEVVRRFKDSRIRLIRQPNAGVSAARNSGIEQARYEWIALLDGDDLWREGYLQSQWNLHLKYPECSICACNFEFCNREGKRTPTQINRLPFKGTQGVLTNYFEVASSSHPPLWTSAIIAQRDALLCVGGFPVEVKLGEDLITWARLALKYDIAYSSVVQAQYLNFSNDNTPPAAPDIKDLVGDALELLAVENKSIVGLREYTAIWHKMRAVMFLNADMSYHADVEFKKMWRLSNPSLKLYTWMVISKLPNNISKYIISKL